jgi:hypothetical protein
MKNKSTISDKPEFEKIDDELFNSFDPEEENWVFGGSESPTHIYTRAGTLTTETQDTPTDVMPDI